MAAPRGTLYRIEIIEELRRQLRCLPEPQIAEVSKLEVLRALAPDIEALQKAGHTMDTIASTLSGLGVKLTTSTLKTYLGKLRPAGHRRRGRHRQGTAGRPATSPETHDHVAATSSPPPSVARPCDAPPVENDSVRSTGRNAGHHSADDRKEKRSVTTQEMPEQTAPAAGTTATADASRPPDVIEERRKVRHEVRREMQQSTTDGSNGPESLSERSQATSEKPALRGSGTPTPIERPAWSFVPRQDSNDI